MNKKLKERWLEYMSLMSFDYEKYTEINIQLDIFFKTIYRGEEINITIFFNFINNNFQVLKKYDLINIDKKELKSFLIRIVSPSLDSFIKIDELQKSNFTPEIKLILLKIIFIYDMDEMTLITNKNKLANLINYFNLKIKNLTDINIMKTNKLIFQKLQQEDINENGIILTNFLENINLDKQEIKQKSIPAQEKEKSIPEIIKEELNIEKTTPIEIKLLNKKALKVIKKPKLKITKKEKNHIKIKKDDNFQIIKNKLQLFFKNSYNTRILGIPSTGKSHYLNEHLLKKTGIPVNNIFKIAIEKGLNGTNSNRLILGYGYKEGIPTDKKGLLLKIIQKAINNPYQQYVINLEDVHNQSIDDLLSPITPITKNNDRFELGLFINLVLENINDDFIVNQLNKYKIEIKIDTISYKNYSKLVFFIKDIIEYFRNYKEIYIKNLITIQLPQIIESKKENNIIFIPDNLYINMTSNYGENSILPIEWEDRITTRIFLPYNKNHQFKKFISKVPEIEKNQLKLIETYLKINNLIEEKLYEIELEEPWKLSIGQYLIVENNNIIDNEVAQLKIIKKMYQTIFNNCKAENIYNFQEILLFIISNMTELELIQKFLQKSNINFYSYKEIKSWESLENTDKKLIKKEIYRLIS